MKKGFAQTPGEFASRMQRWEDMTEEERELYVNQDAVKLNRREMLFSSDCPPCHSEAAPGASGLAAVFAGLGHLDEDSVLYRLIDPVSMECLRLYYGEGRSCRQIADSIKMQCVVDGCVFVSRKLTSGAVKKRLSLGRAALRKALGENVLQGLKNLRDNQ